MDRIKNVVLGILFPRKCAFCRKIIRYDSFVCKTCEKENIQHNFREFMNIKKGQVLVPYVSPFLYKDGVRLSIHRMKFRNNPDIAEFFANKIYEAYSAHNEFKFDYIAYVPMTEDEELREGFNHAKVLALMLSKVSGVPLIDALNKIRETKRQHTLTKSERIKNVKGAFSCALPDEIKGKRVLIIDDVITTGSTILECTRMLYKGGALIVECACAAKP